MIKISDEISNVYVQYRDLIDFFGKSVITSRVAQIMEQMEDFIRANNLGDFAYVNDVALTHAVLDYFSDIRRNKIYQHVEHVSEVKIKAYETYWLLQRKPIQLKAQLQDDTWLYINEKFILVRLTCFLLQDDLTMPLVGERKLANMNLFDTLYYNLKFHPVTPQTFELMILAFRAGQTMSEEYHPEF